MHNILMPHSKSLSAFFFASVLLTFNPVSNGFASGQFDMEKMKEELTTQYFSLINNVMFGDGSDPLVMPTSNNVPAQKFFDKVLRQQPTLQAYATRLDDYLRDLYTSKDQTRASMLQMIEDELKGKISAHKGFASDYVSPTSPFRKVMLTVMHSTLNLLELPAALQMSSTTNMKFNFSNIEHLEYQFGRDVNTFKTFLTSFAQDTKKPEKKLNSPLDPSLPPSFARVLSQFSQDSSVQASLFHRHYQLMDLEAYSKRCLLYLPLLNAILEDKNTSRKLRNSNKNIFDSLNTNISLYQKLQQKLETHLVQFNRDRKLTDTAVNTTPKVEEVKEPITPSTKKEEKTEPQPSPAPQPSLASRIDDEKGNVEKEYIPQGKQEKKFEQPSATTTSPTISSQRQEEPLVNWLMNRQNKAENLKREYQSPSPTELKEERKRLGKEEKKKQQTADIKPS